MTEMKIVVGVDGSAPSTRALEWCGAHAAALDAEVVAVFALDMPVYAATGFGAAPIPMPMPTPSEAERAELHRTIEEDWCKPLAKAHVPFRVVVRDGPAAAGIMAVAEEVGADLVVTGRRGRGGFAELLLGSTSHHLAHHLNRPLIIVP
jgi:nucleotide-binding universal stress UspA family protein